MEENVGNEENVKTPKGKLRRRWLAICLAVLVFVGCVLGVLQIGVWYVKSTWEFWSPDYEKVDIMPLLIKDELTDKEYETLYYQTGMTKLAIDDVRTKKDYNKALEIQANLFREYNITCRRFNPFTYIDEIDGFTTLAPLRDGDIIVSSTTHVSWWRYGHAAMVVDGANGTIIESVGPGSKSQLFYAESFCDLANFLVLRPKVDEATKAQIVDFAVNNMQGLPYRFTVGILSKKFNEKEIKFSQCAHLVWYAYKKFGYDLDSNGKGIVKPQDMALSEHVEVVQAFGFDLDTLWS